MRLKVTAAMAAALLLGVLGGSSARAAFNGGTGTAACSDGTVTWSPAKLWPPNHTLRTVTISYDEAENDGDAIGLSVTAISSDDDGLEKGSTANNEPDFTGVGNSDSGVDSVPPSAADPATVTVQLRSERMGKDRDGRTYTISVSCSDNGNVSLKPPESGSATLQVIVPHDRRHA